MRLIVMLMLVSCGWRGGKGCPQQPPPHLQSDTASRTDACTVRK